MYALWATLIALGASTAGMIAFLLIGSCAIAYISTHPPRRRLKRTPAEFGAEYETVQFTARDGVKLSGWYVPSSDDTQRPRGVVILCHGMSANRATMISWAASLWQSGFALLLFDFRALGQSEGDICTAGYQETLDLHGAVDYITSRPEMKDVPLGVFGFSMGGATAILTAAENSRIEAVATHGAFATLDRAISQRCRHHFGPLGPIARWLTVKFGSVTRWYPVATSTVSPINAVSNLAPRPLLVMHGVQDKIVHPTDARDLHAAAGGPKQLHLLPRSGHSRIHSTLQAEVRGRVVQFFCDHLTPEAEPLNSLLLPANLRQPYRHQIQEDTGLISGLDLHKPTVRVQTE